MADLNPEWVYENDVQVYSSFGNDFVRLADYEAALEAARSAVPAQASAPDGDWLWAKLMDWCNLRGVSPADYNDLFAIVAAARSLPPPVPSPVEPSAPGPDAAEVDFAAWMAKRGPLGAGAVPERIFFAGHSAGRRSVLASTPAPGGEPSARVAVEFAQGVIYACARIVEMFDQPTIAENILAESGVSLLDGCPEDVAFLAAHAPAPQEPTK